MRKTCSNASFFNREEDKELLEMIRALVDQRPTYGYRRITSLLNQKLGKIRQKLVNHKTYYFLAIAYFILL